MIAKLSLCEATEVELAKLRRCRESSNPQAIGDDYYSKNFGSGASPKDFNSR